MKLIGKILSAAGFPWVKMGDFYCVNPATGKKMEPVFYEASHKEINAAIEKSSEAFQQYPNKSG